MDAIIYSIMAAFIILIIIISLFGIRVQSTMSPTECIILLAMVVTMTRTTMTRTTVASLIESIIMIISMDAIIYSIMAAFIILIIIISLFGIRVQSTMSPSECITLLAMVVT